MKESEKKDKASGKKGGLPAKKPPEPDASKKPSKAKSPSGKQKAPAPKAAIPKAAIPKARIPKPSGFKARSSKHAKAKEEAARNAKARKPPEKASGKSGSDAKCQAAKVIKAFDGLYPTPSCGLEESEPYGLLVATILSAQCTDERVNKVAPRLLKTYPGPKEMSEASPESIENIIKSCGFFRMKAKNIQACSKALLERFSGKVPKELDELVTLPGVGRKTANCVIGNAFGLPGITVDTHLGRISRRLGLTENTDPAKVEADLAALLPKESWTRFSHQGIAHGRTFCRSQRPLCDACPLTFCRYPSKTQDAKGKGKKGPAGKKSPAGARKG
jgi:endonuclease-3